MCTRQHPMPTHTPSHTYKYMDTHTHNAHSFMYIQTTPHSSRTHTHTHTHIPTVCHRCSQLHSIIHVHVIVPSPSPLHRCSVCWCSNKRRRRGSTETTTRPYHNGAANLKCCTGEYRTDWGTARGLIWEWVVWISLWCAGLCCVYGCAVEYECDGRWQS